MGSRVSSLTFDFADTQVLVTGGTSGIGLAIAARLGLADSPAGDHPTQELGIGDLDLSVLDELPPAAGSDRAEFERARR